MQQSQKALGILGGTFDPIHMGHLRMALELYENLNLEKVHLIPCFQPVHRKMPTASPEQRLKMVQCAVENEPALFVDDREIKRNEPSFMIDTLQSLRQENPSSPLCLMLGIDAFLGFTSWHRWEDILEEAHIIVAHRPQYKIPASGMITDIVKARVQTDPAYLREHLAGGIFVRPITALEISASVIRNLIASGKSPRYLLPEAVYEYIKQHGTYSLSQI